MAKRFIDTEIFADEYFSELSKEGKLFFIYFITQCNHAGILKLNKKLCEFQTGLKSLDTLIKELGKSLVRVNEESVYFMPSFLKFQYPDFPKSTVKAQVSALKILENYNINLDSYLTVSELLPKSYVYDNGNGNVLKEKEEAEKTELHPLQKWILETLPTVQKLKTQLTLKNCEELLSLHSKEKIKTTLMAMENKADLLKKYTSVYLTCLNWLKTDNTPAPTKSMANIDYDGFYGRKKV